jgi:hypothetical protein
MFTKYFFINWWFRYAAKNKSAATQPPGLDKTKNPDAGSGLDEVKYGYPLFSHRYAHINLPTMRGLNMMMVVLERGLVIHVGRYSMPGQGMSQGEMEKSPSNE